MNQVATILIMFAAFLWSTDALLRLPLTEHLSSQVIVFYEHLFGVVLLLPVLLFSLRKYRNLSRRDWVAILFIGIGGSALATVLFTQSFNYVSPSVSILLQKVQPIIVIILAAAFLRERMGKFFWLWAGLAMVGAYVISFPRLVPDWSLSDSRGIYLALGAAGLWAASTVAGRMIATRLSFPALTAIRLLTALVFLILLMNFNHSFGDIGSLQKTDVWSLILITLFPGTGALLLYYWGLRHIRASVATIAELFFPFSAVVLNWIYLDERLSLAQIAGGVVLVISIFMVQRSSRHAYSVSTSANDNSQKVLPV
ncbi:MAG: DMT family transporter [Candidatus Kerfeldbacteria bacterium]|nr:DMT family transporter [Candidatus Kerfeldbacteria bacterium]